MAAGAIPIPILDLAVISGVQLKMLAEISKIYDVPFQQSRVKAVVGSLLGAVVPSALSLGLIDSALKALPVAGFVAGGSMVIFCAAAAWALGKVFIQHFESGGTFLTFEPEKVKEYFKAQFEEGRNVTGTMKTEKNNEAPA
jgi:uncharacterized protein (DUF697 family)